MWEQDEEQPETIKATAPHTRLPLGDYTAPQWLNSVTDSIQAHVSAWTGFFV